MTSENHFLGLARGPIDHEASSVINMIADGSIEMGASVKLKTTIDAGELFPRVLQTTAITDLVYGIVVGGDTDGIYSTTGAASGDSSTLAAGSAGEGVVVVTQGRTLARVINDTAVAIGDALAADSETGALVKVSGVTQTISARALQIISTISTEVDIIAVDVQREGLFT